MIEKTGGMIYLAEYGMYGRADIFKCGGMTYCRINNKSLRKEPFPGCAIWLTVHRVEDWFDRDKVDSTLICKSSDLHFRWNESLNQFVPREK